MIGDILYHELKGKLTVSKKKYRRLGNKSVEVAVDENGKEHELDGTEIPWEEQAFKEAKENEKIQKELDKQAEKEAKESQKLEKEELNRQSEVSAVKEVISKIEMAKGNPGNDGYTPERGKDYWTEKDKEELVDEIWKKVVIPTPKDGRTPEAGVDYPSYEEVQSWVEKSVSKIPRPKEVDLLKLADAVLKMVKIPSPLKGEKGKDGSPDTPDQVKEKLESLKGDERLDAKAIKNLPKPVFGGGGGIKRIDAATDTRIINPANGEVLKYNSSRQVWENSTGGGGSGVVETIVAGNNIDVDATDPANPVVSVETLTLADISDVTASTAEINVLDGIPATLTATELGYVDGVTSAIQTQINAKAADADVVHDTGDETIAGVKTFSSDPIIPDEAYGAGWNGSLEVPTKNAVYDKLELFAAGTGIDHSGLTGLGDDDHTQYAFLAGRAAGQVLYGGTAANEDLTIEGTSHATKTTSYVILQPTSGKVGIGTTGPLAALDVNGVTRALSSAGTAPTGGIGLEYFYKASTDTGNIYSYDRTNSIYKDLNLNDKVRIIGSTGKVGIGTTTPTAVLHLKAGTATANTAPLKLTSGTLNTTPEAGAVEFLTDKFYGTITTGAARQTFAMLESAAQTFSNDVMVPDEAYGAGWNGSLEVPTKNAVYDKIEALSVGSGITRTVVVTSGSITLGATASTDYVYFVAGAHTLSMPSPNTNRYTIKNNHSANITVDTAGAELIEGAASISIAPQEAVDILSDGTNWLII